VQSSCVVQARQAVSAERAIEDLDCGLEALTSDRGKTP